MLQAKQKDCYQSTFSFKVCYKSPLSNLLLHDAIFLLCSFVLKTESNKIASRKVSSSTKADVIKGREARMSGFK
jgi:hypothetical protein